MTSQRLADLLPLTTHTDGRTYISTDEVSRILRGIALAAVGPGEPNTLAGLGIALMAEADALDCRAIAHTTETS